MPLQKGFKHSEKTKSKIRDMLIGHKTSEETRKKLSKSLTGRIFTEEHKKKISEGNKGSIPWNKGTIGIMIPWNKNKKGLQICSDETRRKMSFASKGRKHSKKTIEKIRLAKLGSRNPFYGKHHSEKTRRILSERSSGENCAFWKGGVTLKNQVIRTGIEIRLWREAVFARDSYTCQKTKIRGGELQSHHIKNFAEYPELRFAIDNGITFSKKVHNEFHKKYGKKHNTQDQLIEFLNCL